MQISEHYSDYPNRTYIVVTNNEIAKILFAHKREIKEKYVIETPTNSPQNQSEESHSSSSLDTDEVKNQKRLELYKKLSDKLISLLKKEKFEIILCAPEANKNILIDAMHADVRKKIDEVIPKNLASLNTDQIVRILQETRV